MIALDGLNIVRVGSEFEPVYVIMESRVTVASVQAFVVSATALVDPEALWIALGGMEEEAVLKVKDKTPSLSAMDIFDEMEDAFEYAGIDISEFD